jgi:hypothetical protein
MRGRCTGISFIDSTPLKVCHIRRIYSHEVFKIWAARRKSSTGWFYGFKLHLLINDMREICFLLQATLMTGTLTSLTSCAGR